MNFTKQDIEMLPKICDEYIQHFEQWVQSKENSFILHSNYSIIEEIVYKV